MVEKAKATLKLLLKARKLHGLPAALQQNVNMETTQITILANRILAELQALDPPLQLSLHPLDPPPKSQKPASTRTRCHIWQRAPYLQARKQAH